MTTDFLNRLAPDFSLPVLGGGRFNLADLRGHVIVLNFWSAECPWSRRADVVLVYRKFKWDAQGVRVVGIACNYNEPEAEIQYEVERRHIRYPILLDAEQKIADLYGAVFTPQFYILDRHRVLRYTGALDDARSNNQRARRIYVDEAVAALVAGRLPEPAVTPPFGCNILRLRAAPGDKAIQVSGGQP